MDTSTTTTTAITTSSDYVDNFPSTASPNNHNHNNSHNRTDLILNEFLSLNLNLTKEQQKQLLNSVKLNDPPSLLKELLKYRHSQTLTPVAKTPHHYSSLKHKFNCYSSKSADLDEDDREEDSTTPTPIADPNNNNNNNDQSNSTCISTSTLTSSGRLNALNSSDEESSPSSSHIVHHHHHHPPPAVSLIQFESPIKRKCIIKNYRKPKFNQWKSYWLQLVGGNLLIYYPQKTIMFRSSSTSSAHEPSPDVVVPASSPLTHQEPTSTDNVNNLTVNNRVLSSSSAHQLLVNQQQKQNYHKNPCKMHQIANWMVVNLYQDLENELISQAGGTSPIMTDRTLSNSSINNGNNNQNSTNSNSNSSSSISNNTGGNKFDIQLNDLNNGNMYKYRFESLELAKEWYEKFKLATTYHERQKPDNLIRFD